MFDDIPDNYKGQTSTDEEEGWRYTQGDKNAKRPPELLTRDHVARCITREIKEGRGSPHGGVFLDIAWIKEKISNAQLVQEGRFFLEAGKLDECEECNEPIGYKRLLARPVTTLCIECKSAREQVEADEATE